MKKNITLVLSIIAFSVSVSAQTDMIEETTTTTTGNQNVNTNVNMGVPGGSININMNVPAVQTTTTTTTTTTRTNAQPAQQPVRPSGNGCFGPCSSGDFQSMKSSISGKPFEENKVQIAKQIIGSNCVSAAQVRELMNLFSFEDSKLDVAKFSYGRCTDPNNYYKVNDAFSFSSSIDDLNAFISGR